MGRGQKSTNAWTARRIKDVRSKLFRRASADVSFRRRCLENASAAIKEISGLELPEVAPRIRFVDQLEEVTIVLPPLGGGPTELAEGDLSLVVGGLQAEMQRQKQECAKMLGVVASVVVVSDPTLPTVQRGQLLE